MNGRRAEWSISAEEAKVIEDEVLQPYREHERKLQEYEQAITEAVQIEYPFSERTEADLKDYQKYLGLQDSDITAVEVRVLSPLRTEQDRQQEERRKQNAIAHCEQGNALHKQGKLDEAIEQYRQAIQLNPNEVIAYNNLGYTLYKQGKLDEAIEQYRQAIQLNPRYADAYDSMGEALKAQGKLDEAIAQHRQAIQLNPKLAGAYNNLGLALDAQGKQQEAQEAFQRAEQLGFKKD
ncbi:MAG: tetratricopeptide repeat protein [Microcoleus sp. SIO2G3]|nr:tetratricopeptide repeat protein [Microcoleus sp. SIO2G3]